MNQRGLTLLEVFVVIAVISILAALLIPSTCLPKASMRCAENLRQLYALGTVYASTHQGAWPDLSGDELWLSFTKTKPPLIAEEHLSILACPLREEECGPGETHYFGPKVPYQRLGSDQPLAADKPGNHGEKEGGNMLFKDGRVGEFPGR